MSFNLYREEKISSTGLKIVHLSSYNIANIPYLLSKGLNKYSNNSSVCVTFTLPFCDYIKYPEDYMYGINLDKNGVVRLIQEADIIHLHNSIDELLYHARRGGLDLQKLLSTKKNIILHGHGTYHRAYKNNIEKYRKIFNFTDILATPDALLMSNYPAATFIPNPIEVDLTTPKFIDNQEIIKISHSPTNRKIKSTDYFEKIIFPVLKNKFKDKIQLKYIYKSTNQECLKIRSECAINFDQILIGAYGVGAQESLSQRIIPLVRISREVEEIINSYFNNSHPFLLRTKTKEDEKFYNRIVSDLSYYRTSPAEDQITKRTLEIPKIKNQMIEELEKLIDSPSYREYMRDTGFNWIRQTHDLPIVIKKLLNYYYSIVRNND